MNVDAEIYLKQLFSFFNTNPDQLVILIGDMSKDNFFDKIRNKVYEHVEKGESDMELTRKEMIDVIKELYDETKLVKPNQEKTLFMKTEFGTFGLN
jgi:hypothetical protein